MLSQSCAPLTAARSLRVRPWSTASRCVGRSRGGKAGVGTRPPRTAVPLTGSSLRAFNQARCLPLGDRSIVRTARRGETMLASPALGRRCLYFEEKVGLERRERVIRSADLLVHRRLAQARHNLRWWPLGSRPRAAPPPGRLPFADTEPLCRRLTEEQKMLLVPGKSFGNPGHLRLGLGCATHQLVEGLRRLSLPGGARRARLRPPRSLIVRCGLLPGKVIYESVHAHRIGSR